MFTGIIQLKGQVQTLSDRKGIRAMTLVVDHHDDLSGLKIGASVAVNGTCLTVVAFEHNWVRFDAIDETLRLTNLGQLKVGDEVNLERAARFGDEIGGHLLSGHIHCQAELLERNEQGDNLSLVFQVPEPYAKYVLSKGYIALDGISLTLGEHVQQGRFNVHLIPETRRATTIEQRKPGEMVNIEIDSQTQAVVDTVERVMKDCKPAEVSKN